MYTFVTLGMLLGGEKIDSTVGKKAAGLATVNRFFTLAGQGTKIRLHHRAGFRFFLHVWKVYSSPTAGMSDVSDTSRL